MPPFHYLVGLNFKQYMLDNQCNKRAHNLVYSYVEFKSLIQNIPFRGRGRRLEFKI